MRESAVKMFVRGFLKSFFILAILVAAGTASYQAVMHFFGIPKEDVIETFESQKVQNTITTASIDDISKNLIYSVDEETGDIEKILLEIFHCERNELLYITIPVRTQFTMSDSLYQKLILVHPAVPQVVKLTSIPRYFDKDSVYDYGVLMMEDLLKMDISYYTVIPKDLYDTMFITWDKEEKQEVTKDIAQIEQEVVSQDITETKQGEVNQDRRVLPQEVFSDEYISLLKGIETAEELSNYIEDSYEKIKSNLSLFGKMNYLESYCKTSLSNVSFDLIRGEDKNSAYIIDRMLATKQIDEFINKTNQE